MLIFTLFLHRHLVSLVSHFTNSPAMDVDQAMAVGGIDHIPFNLLLLARITQPLQGVFNILIYTRPHVKTARERHPSYNYLQALWEVVKSGGDYDIEDSSDRNRRSATVNANALAARMRHHDRGNHGDNSQRNVNVTQGEQQGRRDTISTTAPPLLHFSELSNEFGKNDDEEGQARLIANEEEKTSD